RRLRDQPLLPPVVRHEALELADRHGSELLAQHAGPLALRLLRAHASANGRQAVRLADGGQGAAVVPLEDAADEAADIDADGAALRAHGVAAVQAAQRLDQGGLLVEARRNFGEIPGALGGIPLEGLLSRDL